MKTKKLRSIFGGDNAVSYDSDVTLVPIAMVLSKKDDALDLTSDDIKKAMHDRRYKAAGKAVRHALRRLHTMYSRPGLAILDQIPRADRLLIEQALAASCAAMMVRYFAKQREARS